MPGWGRPRSVLWHPVLLGLSLSPDSLISSFGLIGIFVIVFAESGLLIGFFLPGDSLLFTAGAIAAGVFKSTDNDALNGLHFNIWVLLIGVFLAAALGDQVGYLFGRRVGPALFRREDSRLFKQEYVNKAQEFFDRHGPKAIVMARFVPIVRTFTPILAGVSHMNYSIFVRFNVIGALLWGVGVTMLGYLFGQIDVVRDNIEVALIGIVAISLLPMVIEFVRHRRARAAS